MAYKPLSQTVSNGKDKEISSSDAVFDAVALKQNSLVSGTNIKTVGGASVLGSGELVNAASSTASSTTHTVDLSLGPAHTLTLNSSISTLTLSNPVSAGAYVLKVVQGVGGSFTISFPNTVKWAGASPPTLSTAAGAVDIITMVYVDSTFYATAALGFA